MKLYLECNMGAAGDMLMGALVELLPDKNLFLQRMRGLCLPNVEISCERVTKSGITGTKMHVYVKGIEEGAAGSGRHTHVDREDDFKPNHLHVTSNTQSHIHNDKHERYGYKDICSLISGLDLAENVKNDALEVYRLIAEAESAVHGVPLDKIHFHEVGAFDAVADIVGCCMLFQMLGADRIEASPVHVGSGYVRTEHGALPVPSPAAAHILRGVPIYGGLIKGELCTPTGAALLRRFVTRFGEMEPMTVSRIGYGMGTRDYEVANCLRAYLCEHKQSNDTVIEIVCNLDDMTPEAIGYATKLLMENGALDVYTTPVTMKKNRPAVLLTCLCLPDDKSELTRLILQHTTTLGLRYQVMQREVLTYTFYSAATKYGSIRIKSASGYGVLKEKPEYEDVKSAAEAHGVPFTQVYAAAAAAMNSSRHVNH